ncbi:MAG: hypothetical protein H7343_14420 [Undibacterium sp.]|nr:hypothetical protein [Opitutaceae bacterium]
MLVRFTKNALSARADTLTCILPDGTSTVGPMPRQAILPHDAFHYVVETTLGWRDAFLGQIADGRTHDEATAGFHGPKSATSRQTGRARQTETLIECLQAEQWGGASDPATFTAKLAETCRRRRAAPLVLTAADLARLRIALRDFGAAWRPLAPGQFLERTF